MPSTSMIELSGSTRSPIVAVRPSIWTRPAATSASLARREATPAFARTFWIRSVGTVSVLGGWIGLGGSVGAFLGETSSHVDIERRQLVERREPKSFEELEAGAVEDRPARRVRPAELRQEPSMEQAPERVVGIDAADPLDGGSRDRLAVGDDREGLEARRRQPDRVHADVSGAERACLGRGRKREPLARRDQPDAAFAERDLHVPQARGDRLR